jgi:hypothetical protein
MFAQENLLIYLGNYPGPYYPLDTIGTVPGAYDIFKVYEGM